jgi:hypothetical protein
VGAAWWLREPPPAVTGCEENCSSMTCRRRAASTSLETERFPRSARRLTAWASSGSTLPATVTLYVLFTAFALFTSIPFPGCKQGFCCTLPAVTVVVSGHDLVQSHDCSTVSCDEEGTVQLGSLWYCRHHAGPIPKDATSAELLRRDAARASKNGSTPADRREVARRLRDQGLTHRAIAERLNVSTSTVGNYLNSTAPKSATLADLPEPAAKPNGQSFEFRAAALVELGRRVDAARAGLEPAQAAYEEACRRWQEAIERLPAAVTNEE